MLPVGVKSMKLDKEKILFHDQHLPKHSDITPMTSCAWLGMCSRPGKANLNVLSQA